MSFKFIERILALALLVCLTIGSAALSEAEAPNSQAFFQEILTDTALETTAPEFPDNAEESLPWNLTLVNATHAVPENWTIEFTELKNGQRVDSRIYPELQQMFDACRADGLKPRVKSSFRTYEDQQGMLVQKYKKFKNQGMSKEEAQQEALKWAAYPGYSEHQLGLAVDIGSADSETCSNDSVYTWLEKHCAEYGFILRYTQEKSGITGIAEERWHFRYVGQEAASYMMENGLCLEEYLEQFYSQFI